MKGKRMTLHEIGLECGTNKSFRHGFLHFYENYLEPYRYHPINLMELGIGKVAGSAKMWDKYFGNPSAKFVMVDKDPVRIANGIRSNRWTNVEMDATNFQDLDALGEDKGPFDFIIDDCVHSPMIQRKTFGVLWDHLKPGGIYFMEDIGRSYMHGDCRDKGRKKFGIDYYLDTLLHRMVVHPEDRKWDTDIAYMHFYPHVVILGKTV